MRKIGYLLFAADVMILDQLSKWGVTEHIIRPMLEGDQAKPMGLTEWYANTPEPLMFASQPVLPFFSIVMVWNKGVSFGMLKDAGDYGPILLTCLSFAICAWFTVWLFKTNSRVQSFALAAVIAGAIGNVIDRLRFGAVIDFLDFHIARWHWPAFNIADSCIVCGVFVLIIYSLLFEKNLKPEESNS